MQHLPGSSRRSFRGLARSPGTAANADVPYRRDRGLDGLTVTINSDVPAYFGGYVNENYESVRDALGLGDEVRSRKEFRGRM